MRKIILLYLCFVLLGCSSGVDKIKTIVTDPQSLINDAQFAEHKKQLNDLERVYLRKEISYAVYVEQKKQIEDDYNKEIQTRTDKIDALR